MVTVLELSIFIQKVLWLKLLWIREFLFVIQEGVQCRNYDCALEGIKVKLAKTMAFDVEASCLEFYLTKII